MKSSATVTLPGGFWIDSVRYQQAELHPLTGKDEAFLWEVGDSLIPVQQTTAMLTRCLTCLGPLNPVKADVVLSLTVGDREALLLHLRRLTIGECLQCVLTCPNPSCCEKMDLDLKVSELLLHPYSNARERYEKIFTKDGIRYRVGFRLPTGSDHESAALLAATDAQQAAEQLLNNCIAWVIDESEPKKNLEHCPPVVAQKLPAVMADLDPQAELRLDLTCPVCGHRFSTILDMATFFFQELTARVKHLYQEVHVLALSYHWSEAEIIGMTARKRHRYLDLLSNAFD